LAYLTSRKLFLTALLVAVAMEVLAFQSLETVPLDIDYPPGTSDWVKLLEWPGIIIHYPALFLYDWIEPLFPWKLALFVLGYLDALIVISVIVFLWRVGRRVISPP
jgi:hypothetical protein